MVQQATLRSIAHAARNACDIDDSAGVVQEPEELVQAVNKCCEAAQLQAVPALVNKCIQLQETLAVRFGVMLVGPSGAIHLLCHETQSVLVHCRPRFALASF